MRAASHQGQEPTGSASRPDTFTRNVLAATDEKGLAPRGADHTFERISRSSRKRRFSRRSRLSSSRSAVVRPPSPRPRSRSACLTHIRIDQVVQPYSFDSSLNECPARYNSTICRRNSGAYRFWGFPIADSSSLDHEWSTEAGQVHSTARGPCNRRQLFILT